MNVPMTNVEYTRALERKDREYEARAQRLSKIEVVDGPTLFSTHYEEPHWLWNGILPDAGLCIVAASKAVGKTLFLLQLCDAITKGKPFLGAPTTAAKVLFIELELAKRRTRHRLAKMGLVPTSTFNFSFWWEPGKEGIKTIEDYVEEKGAQLIVVDVLQRIWPMNSDSNNYQDVYSVLGPLREMANRLGVLIILVTHTRKMSALDPLDGVLGSVGILGNADVVMILARQRGETGAVLTVEGNDIESQKISLRFVVDPLGFTRSDILPEEIGLTTEQRAVLEGIRTLGGKARTGKIAEKLGKSDQATSNILKALMKDGLVKSSHYGEYSLLTPNVSDVSDVTAPQGPDKTFITYTTYTPPSAGEEEDANNDEERELGIL